jgi:hypothetical protein
MKSTEHYFKELKRTKITGKIYSFHGLGDSMLCLISILPKLIYGFNLIPMEIPTGFVLFFAK